MKDWITENMFEVPTELRDAYPTICPCYAVNNFKCPAKQAGRVLEKCLGTDYQACPNYSAWWHYKRAAVAAKLNKPTE